MLYLIGCLTRTHDVRFVAVACVVCAIASLTTLQMLSRARSSLGLTRWFWVGAGGLAFGCGVWVTHFVAMLGYQPDLPVAFPA